MWEMLLRRDCVSISEATLDGKSWQQMLRDELCDFLHIIAIRCTFG